MNTIENTVPSGCAAADLAVVIPHYNSQSTLGNALASLAGQRGITLEVIIVDDASDTSCEDIVQNARKQGLNASLHVMSRKTGTFGCRLSGMKIANAPYLAFMDADDILTGPDAYSEALQSKTGNPDIIHFNTVTSNKWGLYTIHEYMEPISDKMLYGSEIFSVWLDTGCKAHTVWNKLYSQRLYKAVAEAPHEIKINRIEDFYLCAWFFLLAQSYQPLGLPVYIYNPPKGGSLEKSAARALDCLRMYLDLPGTFENLGLSRENGRRLKEFLRLLVTINGAKMCEYLVRDSKDNTPEENSLKDVLRYGSEEEIFLTLAVANGSNANKLRDIAQILRYSW